MKRLIIFLVALSMLAGTTEAKVRTGSGDVQVSDAGTTSRIELEFEFVPKGLDSMVFEVPGADSSSRRHVCLKARQMTEKCSIPVCAMFNRDAADSTRRRVQIPMTFYYKDRKKAGVMPFKGRMGDGQVFAGKFVDSHETFFDNEYNFEYTLTDMASGATVKKGAMPVSLWSIKKNFKVASDTTKFKLNTGRNFPFWFGSQHVGGRIWSDWKTEFGDGMLEYRARQWADYGFDFYRIPIDEGWCFFSDGKLKPGCEKELKALVDASIDAGVRVILDLHWLAIENLFPNPEQEIRFRKCWEILHDVFGEYDPEWLAYELLNEADAEDGFWNTFVEYNVSMIRSWGGKEVRRPIVVGCGNYQDIDGMSKLVLPKDPNLIASFHDYSPIPFCFYNTGFGAYYGFNKYDGPCHYPGCMLTEDELDYMQKYEPENYAATIFMRNASWEKESLYCHMLPGLEAKKRLNVPVLVGEYGAFPGSTTWCTEYEDRLQYYKDVCSVFRELGLAHSFWFAISKNGSNLYTPDPEILKAVVGK